jgi:hypothetical protein
MITKQYSSILCVLIMIFSQNLLANQNDLCIENQRVANRWLSELHRLNDSVKPLTQSDVKQLIRPLAKDFEIDELSCRGYTKQVVYMAKSTILKKSTEIRPFLNNIYCHKTAQNDTNFAVMAAESKEKFAAKSALTILNISPLVCS